MRAVSRRSVPLLCIYLSFVQLFLAHGLDEGSSASAERNKPIHARKGR